MKGRKVFFGFVRTVFLLFGPLLLIMPTSGTYGLEPWPIGYFLNVLGAMSLISLVHRHLQVEVELRKLQGKRPVPYGFDDDFPPMPTHKEVTDWTQSKQ